MNLKKKNDNVENTKWTLKRRIKVISIILIDFHLLASPNQNRKNTKKGPKIEMVLTEKKSQYFLPNELAGWKIPKIYFNIWIGNFILHNLKVWLAKFTKNNFLQSAIGSFADY